MLGAGLSSEERQGLIDACLMAERTGRAHLFHGWDWSDWFDTRPLDSPFGLPDEEEERFLDGLFGTGGESSALSWFDATAEIVSDIPFASVIATFFDGGEEDVDAEPVVATAEHQELPDDAATSAAYSATANMLGGAAAEESHEEGEQDDEDYLVQAAADAAGRVPRRLSSRNADMMMDDLA